MGILLLCTVQELNSPAPGNTLQSAQRQHGAISLQNTLRTLGGGDISSDIDTNLQPRQNTVRDVLSQVHIVDVRVGVSVGLVGRPCVVLVARDGLGVGRVWPGGLDRGPETLVEEDLADVVHGAARVGVVGEDGVV